MFNQKHLIAGVVLAAVAAQASAAGTYSAKTAAATYLPGGQGYVEVVSLTIPAGTWVVNSLAPAVNFNANDILRCELTVDGVQVSASAAMMGGGSGFPAATPVPNLAVVALPYAQKVAVSCGHDGNVAGQRIDPGTWLVVSRAPAK